MIGVHLNGRVFRAAPCVIWLRADLTPHEAARRVAHEARHLWQWRQEPVGQAHPEHGRDALEVIEAMQKLNLEREADAEAYSQKVAPLS
jgi:hypothetical protein